MQEEPIICSNCKKEVHPPEKVEQALRRGEIVVEGYLLYPDSNLFNCPNCVRLRMSDAIINQRNIKTS